ncbi:MAG: tetratricopeptide (TPR) repeat protein [Glaciecola sp.]|jgi:tetratricopeptide (TPR) repeat protein
MFLSCSSSNTKSPSVENIDSQNIDEIAKIKATCKNDCDSILKLKYYEISKRQYETETQIELDSFGKTPSNLYNQAFKLTTNGEYQTAMILIDSAISISPKMSFYHSLRGTINKLMNKSDEIIIKDFSTAIKLDPYRPLVFIERAGVYIATGQYDLAKKDIDKALEIDYKSTAALYTSFWLEGINYKQVNKYDQAISMFEEMKKVQPKFAKPYFEIAEIFILKEDTLGACEEFNLGVSFNGPINRNQIIDSFKEICGN